MIEFSRYVITTYEVGPYQIIIFQNNFGDLLNIIVDVEFDGER